jgi:hypothetical protein
METASLLCKFNTHIIDKHCVTISHFHAQKTSEKFGVELDFSWIYVASKLDRIKCRFLTINICYSYTRGGKSNMAVAEINSLSGYKFDNDDIGKLTSIPDLQRVELDKDDTQMNIYFNPLGDDPVCLSIMSELVYQIADQKPAQLSLYDYYDPEQQIKATYSARQSRSLDESCPDCWPELTSAQQLNRPSFANGSSMLFAPCLLILLIASTLIAI